MAIGLLHFNINYIAGDQDSQHRYCQQIILPLLFFLTANPSYRMSLEMCGWDLEFLSDNYPLAIEALFVLLRRDQVDLLSSVYTPSFWPAFPLRDLRNSILINRKVLSSLGLPVSRIFFAQESFFGPGLAMIDDLFDCFLCKDDYLNHFSAEHVAALAYRLGAGVVIAGSQHITNFLKQMCSHSPSLTNSSRHTEALRDRYKSLPATLYVPFSTEDTSGTDAVWYHMGSAHHFLTSSQPHEGTAFFFDEEWFCLALSVLDAHVQHDCTLSLLSEAVTAITDAGARTFPPFPKYPEGSWNSARSLGVRAWMGRHTRCWEDDSALLALAWKSRTILRACEELIEQLPRTADSCWERQQVQSLWKYQLLAEGSDMLGWFPTKSEVANGFLYCENARLAGSELKLRLEQRLSTFGLQYVQVDFADHSISADANPMVLYEILGNIIEVSCYDISDNMQRLDIDFSNNTSPCGVRIHCNPRSLSYCHSGDEEHSYKIEWKNLGTSDLYLPLANGYLQLDHNHHVIRLNEWGQPAAHVSVTSNWASFLLEGPLTDRRYHWRFILFRGTVSEALLQANAANRI